MKHKEIILLLVCIALPFIVGFTSSFFQMDSISNWYPTLNKPFFNPPNWLFGPAWFTLYILIGISSFLILQKGIKKYEVKEATLFYLIHLFFNGLWSFAFFVFKSPLEGLAVIFYLWVALIITAFKFYPLSKKSVQLLIPYFCWISFATLLNFSIWLLNP